MLNEIETECLVNKLISLQELYVLHSVLFELVCFVCESPAIDINNFYDFRREIIILFLFI